MNCGSSWEVDLRADVDCDKPGLERCHPRYTLGWQHREVQLHRDGMSFPAELEYVHAYCDVWGRGRLEQVLAAPREIARVRDAAHIQLAGRGNMAGPNVVLIVVRGLTLSQSRVRLPRTLRTLGRLRRGGNYRGVAFSRFAAASASGEEAMQALVHGTPESPLPAWAARRSLWKLYEQWGYVTAFGEGGCVTAASRAAGYSLEGQPPMHHALVEPACALDTQLRARADDAMDASYDFTVAELVPSAVRNGSAGRRQRTGREGCVAQGMGDDDLASSKEDEAVLDYMEAFLEPSLYAALPKLAMVALPALHTRPAASAAAVDARLASFVRSVLAAHPHTVLTLTSDVPPPPPYDATGPGSEWLTPMLRVLVPTSGQPRAASEADAPNRRAVPSLTTDGWGAPTGCTCSGYSNGHGFGAHCKAWEKHLAGAENQLPWCYVNDECDAPGTRRTRGSFGKVFADCVHHKSAPRVGVMPQHADTATLNAASDALVANAAVAASAVDLHATLMQLPMLPYAARMPNHTLPATCGLEKVYSREMPTTAPKGLFVGGCSLLRPLPADRACEDTLCPPALCEAQALSRIEVPQSADASSDAVQVVVDPAATPSRRANTSEVASAFAAAVMGGHLKDAFAPMPKAAAVSQLLCKLRAARTRVAASMAVARRDERRRVDSCSGRGATCQLHMPPPDKDWLARVGSEADMFVCDAPVFATLERGMLSLDCPPSRMPMYSIGLHPKLHLYRGPTKMPNGTEYVAAYCFLADATIDSSACERIGHERKKSNAAAIRRQCPHLSHGWVLDAAVENRRMKNVARRARRRQRVWEERRKKAQLPAGVSARAGRDGGGGGGLGLNVLLLMLDSISAARFKRGMPMTHALLESWTAADGERSDSTPTSVSTPTSPTATVASGRQRRLARGRRHGSQGGDGAHNHSSAAGDGGAWRSFRFDLFSVVGSNSPRNQFPMLSGLTSLQWARDHGGRGHECIVPGFDDGVRADRDHTCDKWVFDDYRATGYVSLFGTNMCDWGVMEEVYPFDTRHPPTDHHLMEPWCHVDYDVDKLYFRPMTRCLGGRPAHAALMKYERDFLRSYERLPRFSWTVYLEGHEPSFRAMANLDADLVAHLLRLRATHGHDTAIFLVSDHGIHYGKYYDNAKAGPAEHSLPLFYALFPRQVLADHPDVESALCVNRRRLVSPFDVHATLLALLSYPEPPSLPDWSSFPARVRPRSLLKTVPAARTCAEAGVPEDACPRAAVSGCAF